MKIHETRIKIQEASEDLQVGGFLFPKYQDKLFEDEDLKTTENRRLGPEERQNAPREFGTCLAHDMTSHAPRACFELVSHAPRGFCMRPCMQKPGVQLSFPASILGKAHTFSANP